MHFLSLSSLSKFFCLTAFCLNVWMMNPLTAGDWSSPVDLSLSGSNSLGAQIVIDANGHSTAIWSQFDGKKYTIQTSECDTTKAWSAPVIISNADGDAFFPQIALDTEGNAAAVWSAHIDGYFTTQVATRSTGELWSTPIALSPSGSDATLPHIVFHGVGNMHVVWQRRFGNQSIIEYAHKEVVKKNWSSATVLSNTATGEFGCKTPRLVISDAGTLIVIWVNIDASSVEAIKKPRAQPWNQVVSLSDVGQPVHNAQIGMDKLGNATVVWLRKEKSGSFVQAVDHPTFGDWSTPLTISDPLEDSAQPSLGVAKMGQALVAWQQLEGSYSVIKTSRREQNGNWSEVFDLTDAWQDASEPKVVMGLSDTHAMVWKRSDGANFVIQSSKSVKGGPWSVPLTLSLEGEDAVSPSIALNKWGHAVAIWQRSNGTNSIIQCSSRQLLK